MLLSLQAGRSRQHELSCPDSCGIILKLLRCLNQHACRLHQDRLRTAAVSADVIKVQRNVADAPMQTQQLCVRWAIC